MPYRTHAALFSPLIISNPFLQSIAQYGACMAHISIRVCASVFDNILPSIFARHRGHRYLPQTAGIFSCLRHRAEACCTAWITRTAWRPDEASVLISANRSTPGVPERACGAHAEHGPGVRCKAIHITGFGARRFHSSVIFRRMYNKAVSGCRGQAVPGPDGSTRFQVTTYRFGVVPRPALHGR